MKFDYKKLVKAIEHGRSEAQINSLMFSMTGIISHVAVHPKMFNLASVLHRVLQQRSSYSKCVTIKGESSIHVFFYDGSSLEKSIADAIKRSKQAQSAAEAFMQYLEEQRWQ